MDRVGNYLEKFKKLAAPHEEVRKILSQAIEGVAGIKIEARDISVRGTVAYIGVAAALKSEIFLNKKKILGSSGLSVGGEKITDIR